MEKKERLKNSDKDKADYYSENANNKLKNRPNLSGIDSFSCEELCHPEESKEEDHIN